MNETQEKQVAMHKDFFDRCQTAIESEFYMEALLMEYAAMESRLEIILGVSSLPCNKNLPTDMRKDIKISHRLRCLENMVKKSPLFETSKLDKAFFQKADTWIKARNQYVHGLYKNEWLYEQRKDDAGKLAENGLMLCKLLYNEARRLRRFVKNRAELLNETAACRSKGCKLYRTVL